MFQDTDLYICYERRPYHADSLSSIRIQVDNQRKRLHRILVDRSKLRLCIVRYNRMVTDRKDHRVEVELLKYILY